MKRGVVMILAMPCVLGEDMIGAMTGLLEVSVVVVVPVFSLVAMVGVAGVLPVLRLVAMLEMVVVIRENVERRKGHLDPEEKQADRRQQERRPPVSADSVAHHQLTPAGIAPLPLKLSRRIQMLRRSSRAEA